MSQHFKTQYLIQGSLVNFECILYKTHITVTAFLQEKIEQKPTVSEIKQKRAECKLKREETLERLYNVAEKPFISDAKNGTGDILTVHSDLHGNQLKIYVNLLLLDSKKKKGIYSEEVRLKVLERAKIIINETSQSLDHKGSTPFIDLKLLFSNLPKFSEVIA